MTFLLIAILIIVAFGAGMLYAQKTPKSMNYTDATWYLFELTENGESVFFGIAKNPEIRFYQLCKIKPNPAKKSSYGLFYGRDVEMQVLVGYENKKDALETLRILKADTPSYVERLKERRQINSIAGRASMLKGTHNMLTRYRCSDGKIVTGVWLRRYCEKHNLDPSEAVRL